jgi:hypothetical protein
MADKRIEPKRPELAAAAGARRAETRETAKKGRQVAKKGRQVAKKGRQVAKRTGRH